MAVTLRSGKELQESKKNEKEVGMKKMNHLTETYQKNHKDCLAVTLRSGKELQESKKNEKEVGMKKMNHLTETYQRKKIMKIV